MKFALAVALLLGACSSLEFKSQVPEGPLRVSPLTSLNLGHDNIDISHGSMNPLERRKVG